MEPGTLCVMTTMTVMQLQLFVTSCSVQRHSHVSRVLSFLTICLELSIQHLHTMEVLGLVRVQDMAS